MILLTLSVTIGIVIGLMRGGRFRNVRSVTGRAAPLVAAGLILLAAPSVWKLITGEDLFGDVWVYAAGLAFLIVACLANARSIKGSLIIGLGLFLNFLPVALNGFVPVRTDALRAAYERLRGGGEIVIEGGLWKLEDSNTVLGILGDVIPISVAGYGAVVSFGDLIAIAGICVLTQNLLLTREPEGISVDDFLADAGPVVDLRDIVDVRQPVAKPTVDARPAPAPAPTNGDAAAETNGHDDGAGIEGIGPVRAIQVAAD